MENLFTPWRYAYIRGNNASSEGCFFCAAAAEPNDAERLVVHVASHHLVMLNRHPYTNGHLMVAPLAHVGSPAEASAEARAELWPLVLACREIVTAYSSPDGFNLGMNLGKAAGAGVPDHFHFHVVPRWHGDTNFMGAVADTRIVPQALDDTWSDLRQRFRTWAQAGGHGGGGESGA
jgi:ATP adenylyltransferase